MRYKKAHEAQETIQPIQNGHWLARGKNKATLSSTEILGSLSAGQLGLVKEVCGVSEKLYI